MKDISYMPVKILALQFHRSPKQVRKDIHEMHKHPGFTDFCVDPQTKGSPKLANPAAYKIWLDYRHTQKERFKDYYKTKALDLLRDAGLVALCLGIAFTIGVVGVKAEPSHLIRDGVHTTSFCVEPNAEEETQHVEEESVALSAEDEDLLLHVMMCEAGNQGEYGAALVGRVILNRVESDKFPNTVREVIYQPGQFSTASYLYRYEPNEDCYRALELIESGWDESQGALYFCTTSFSWATYLFSYGGHNFFI